jgi:gamma-glutamylputrescine oxidase
VSRPATYYEASTPSLRAFPPLDGDVRADVCVVGAGFTGLGAALRLAERGLRVVVLDKGAVGSGASGRNGGQIHSGLRRDQFALEKAFGEKVARELWDLGQAAIAHLDRCISRYDIQCGRKRGLIYADHRARFVPHTHAYAEHLRARYGYEGVAPIGRNALQALVKAPGYHGGMVDYGGGHLNPLAFVRGLAEAAAGLGVALHEQTEALSVEPGNAVRIHTPAGVVTADWLILAGDSLMKGLSADADARILPIASTVAVSEPLGARLDEYLATDMAVADSRFVVNYFRPTEDRRLLFGGGESYSTTPVRDPARLVHEALKRVFPDHAALRFDYAWSGVVGITQTRYPLVRRMDGNVLIAAGYSGQGVALAPFAGAVLAETVLGNSRDFDLLSRLPVPAFPGGAALRQPLLVLAMLYYAARDRF